MKQGIAISLILLSGTIVWKRPDDSIAVTTVVIGTAESEAVRLKENGTIPANYEVVAFNPAPALLPNNRENRNRWKWNGLRIIEDVLPSTATLRGNP